MTQTIWLSTKAMADVLGIHSQTLTKIRRDTSIFKRGRDFRTRGLSVNGPLQWHPINTDKAFTNGKRIDPKEVETFEVGVL